MAGVYRGLPFCPGVSRTGVRSPGSARRAPTDRPPQSRSSPSASPRASTLFASPTIDKNAVGIPTERYRDGALLEKGAGKWCEYREFTAHETC